MRRAALLVLLIAPPARAGVEAASRVTVFDEASNINEGIRVIHPQVDVAAGIGSAFKLAAGYELDMVSGATPAVFGPHSGPDAVTGATQFTDTRHAAHGGFDIATPDLGFSASYAYGWEKDYKSHAVTGVARGDFLERNFTLTLGYTHAWESVCDNANVGAQGPLDLQPLPTSDNCFDATKPDVATRKIAIDTLEPTLSWIATPRLVLQAGGSLQILDGFQSNPYRSVLVGSQGRTPQEHLPTYRQRYAVFLRGVFGFPSLRASISAMGRLYRDTWAVEAGTGEVVLNKYLGTFLLVSARGRYHQQVGASFYRTGLEYRNLGPAGEYWTGDRELSPMSNLLGGGKIAYIRTPERGRVVVEEVEVAFKIDYLRYRLESSDAPNSDRKHAIIGQIAVALRF